MFIFEKDVERFAGKEILSVITVDTKVCDDTDPFCFDGKTFSNKGNLSFEQGKVYSVLTDFNKDLVVCFKNDVPIAMFGVYEPNHVKLAEDRGLLIAVGHETIHMLWLDDLEYNEEYTR